MVLVCIHGKAFCLDCPEKMLKYSFETLLGNLYEIIEFMKISVKPFPWVLIKCFTSSII